MLRENGAEAIKHVRGDGGKAVLDAILEATEGRGVDCVVEMLANSNLGSDLKMLAHGGVVAIVGSRGDVTISPRDLMARESSVVGVAMAHATEADWAEIRTALTAGMASGAVQPHVGKEISGLSAASAAEAHRAVIEQAGGAAGKIVILVDGAASGAAGAAEGKGKAS